MDVSWSVPFKAELRKEWFKWGDDDYQTSQGNLQMASRQDVINCVSRAWSRVSEYVIEKSFKQCGISLALDGSEDAELSDNMVNALGAADRKDELDDEALSLILECDSDTDLDFDGFTEDSDN